MFTIPATHQNHSNIHSASLSLKTTCIGQVKNSNKTYVLCQKLIDFILYLLYFKFPDWDRITIFRANKFNGQGVEPVTAQNLVRVDTKLQTIQLELSVNRI